MCDYRPHYSQASKSYDSSLIVTGRHLLVLIMLLTWFATSTSNAAWIDAQVSQGSDDAEEQSTMNLNSSDLELVEEGGTQQIVGIRFQNVTIPQGSTINTADIDFIVDEDDSGATNLTIAGEDEDDTVTFSTANNISDRTRTSATVAW